MKAVGKGTFNNAVYALAEAEGTNALTETQFADEALVKELNRVLLAADPAGDKAFTSGTYYPVLTNRPATVTVTFDSDGGSAVDAQLLFSGYEALEPDYPTKDGFNFDNWYLLNGENLASEPYDFDTPVAENITLKAKWESASVNLVDAGVVTAPTASVATVTAEAVGSTATLNVICAQACTVLYTTDGGTTYTRLDAAAADTGYDFTTTEYADGMTFVVAVKGDVSGDGEISAADFGALVAAYLGTGSLDALNSLVGDVSGDGNISAADFGALVAAYLGTGTIDWMNN